MRIVHAKVTPAPPEGSPAGRRADPDCPASAAVAAAPPVPVQPCQPATQKQHRARQRARCAPRPAPMLKPAATTTPQRQQHGRRLGTCRSRASLCWRSSSLSISSIELGMREGRPCGASGAGSAAAGCQRRQGSLRGRGRPAACGASLWASGRFARLFCDGGSEAVGWQPLRGRGGQRLGKERGKFLVRLLPGPWARREQLEQRHVVMAHRFSCWPRGKRHVLFSGVGAASVLMAQKMRGTSPAGLELVNRSVCPSFA